MDREAGLFMLNTFKIIFIATGISAVMACSAWALDSSSYHISAEVVDLGGASMESSNFRLIAKLREIEPRYITSSGYTLETRFTGIAHGAGIVSTRETPVVSAITPSKGYNNRTYGVIINGYNISSDATARLVRGSLLILPVSGSVTVDSRTSMECVFDLTNKQIGRWDVKIINTGSGKEGGLTGGFTIISPGELKVVGKASNEPNPFNPSEGPTHILYRLSEPASINMYLFNQKGEIVWQKSFSAGENGGSVENDVTWDGMTDFGEGVPTGVYILTIVTKRGQARELTRVRIAVLRH